MEVIPNELGKEWIVLSLGTEETLILLEPGQMLRRVLESDALWADQAKFLTRSDGTPGMLAVLPRAAAPAVLAAPAGHTIERTLKEIIFDQLETDEIPPIQSHSMRLPETR